MNDSWNTTQARLKKWQNTPSPWELRRILSESDHFKIIAANAFRRAQANQKKYGTFSKDVSWRDWWGFYLERVPDRDAVLLLLDVWNKDVWSHRNALVKAQAHEMINDITKLSRIAYERRCAEHGSEIPTPELPKRLDAPDSDPSPLGKATLDDSQLNAPADGKPSEDPLG